MQMTLLRPIFANSDRCVHVFYRATSFENICTTTVKSTISLAIYPISSAFKGFFQTILRNAHFFMAIR